MQALQLIWVRMEVLHSAQISTDSSCARGLAGRRDAYAPQPVIEVEHLHFLCLAIKASTWKLRYCHLHEETSHIEKVE